jgi:hypothetical protein
MFLCMKFFTFWATVSVKKLARPRKREAILDTSLSILFKVPFS